MSPARILNIETATTVCSVSVSSNGAMLAFRELDDGYTHVENLHKFIDEVLKEAHLQPFELAAIAVSKGPGSYTGLRIGASAAKGMSYALELPLISINTLQVMAAAAKEAIRGAGHYCPMIDARRMEIYTRIYDNSLAPLTETEALILDEAGIAKLTSYNDTCFFGNGMPKSKTLLSSKHSAIFLENIVPSATSMCGLSHKKFQQKEFENVAYFEPFYLKDFMIIPQKK